MAKKSDVKSTGINHPVRDTSLTGLAMIALSGVIPAAAAQDWPQSLILLTLGFGLLGYKYLIR